MKRILRLFIFISLITSLSASAQQLVGELSGNIATQDGKGASGITVTLKGTKFGATSDQEGKFSIVNVPAGSYTVVATAIGLQKQERKINIKGNDMVTLSFTLMENAAELEEIIISGARTNKFNRKTSEYVSKMQLNKLENPQVYTSIGKELLTEQLVFSVDDAMRNAPGVQKMWEATGRAGDGGAFYNTRGFIVQSSLRNGVAGVVTSNIDAANLEKMEIIKGPSGTLFGSALTSYGGLINRVTKKPYESFGGEVAFSGGSYDFQRINIDLNTPIDGDHKLLFRINAAYNYEGSFQDRGFGKYSTVAPSLTYKASDRLTINLDAEMFYGTSTGKQLFFFYYPVAQLGVDRADLLNLEYKKSYIGEGLEQNSRSTNFFGQVNYKIAEGFTSSTNFTSSSSFSDGIGPYFYFMPDGAVTGNPADNGRANYIARADQSTGNSKNDLLGVQQNFNADFNLGSLRNRMVLGLDFLRANSRQNFFGSVFDIAPANSPTFNYDAFNGVNLNAKYLAGEIDFTYPVVTVANTYSAYLSDVLNLTEKLSVLAAIRVDRFDNKGGTTGTAVDNGFKQTAWSPKFGIVYQPVKDKVSIFANYQNSFNNQGSYNAYDPTASNNVRPVVADLEQANQIEGGVKVDLFEGKLSSTVSYYDIKVENILRTDPNPAGAALFAQVQDGTQVSKGIEVELIANPFKGFNIIGGFSYNDSKYEQADADVNGRRPATASSPYNANLWLSYRLPDNFIKGLGFGIGGNYASDNKIVNSVSNGVFIIPSYTVLNASAFYEHDRFRFGAKVDNLTNERYWIGYTTISPQKLISVAGTVAYKF